MGRICGAEWEKKVALWEEVGYSPPQDGVHPWGVQVFIGSTRNSLDAKWRLAIPAKFRPDIDADREGEETYAWVTLGLDDNLHIYPRSTFMAMSDELSTMSNWDPNAAKVRSQFYGSAEQVKMDRAGRITIPETLREQAGIDREVVLVGAHNYLELWSAERYDERGKPDMKELFSSIAQGASKEQ